MHQIDTRVESVSNGNSIKTRVHLANNKHIFRALNKLLVLVSDYEKQTHILFISPFSVLCLRVRMECTDFHRFSSNASLLEENAYHIFYCALFCVFECLSLFFVFFLFFIEQYRRYAIS